MLGGIERPQHYTQSAGNISSKACDFNCWVTIRRRRNFHTCVLLLSSALCLTLDMFPLTLAGQCTTQQYRHPGPSGVGFVFSSSLRDEQGGGEGRVWSEKALVINS